LLPPPILNIELSDGAGEEDAPKPPKAGLDCCCTGLTELNWNPVFVAVTNPVEVGEL
jgi:hypothetical protein